MLQIPTKNGKLISSILNFYSKIDEPFLESIRENYLWFSNPEEFNDPYEFNLSFRMPDYDRNEIEELANFLKIAALDSGQYKKGAIEELIKNPKILEEYLNNDFKKALTEKYGVCCFGENDDNLLMWSHYGCKHKGVCLKFDFEKDLSTFQLPVKVEYFEKMPSFDYLNYLRRKDGSLLQYTCGTKFINWNYENEVRIVKDATSNNNFRGKVKYRKQALIEVLFGHRTPENHICDVIKAIEENGYNCKFYLMKLKNDDFGLMKKPLKLL